MLVIEAYRAAIGLDREPKHDAPQDYLCSAINSMDYGKDKVVGELFLTEVER